MRPSPNRRVIAKLTVFHNQGIFCFDLSISMPFMYKSGDGFDERLARS